MPYTLGYVLSYVATHSPARGFVLECMEDCLQSVQANLSNFL